MEGVMKVDCLIKNLRWKVQWKTFDEQNSIEKLRL